MLRKLNSRQFDRDLGGRLRYFRNARGISQDKLAIAASTSQQRIHLIEAGLVGSDIATIVRLGRALGIETSELLIGKVESNRHPSLFVSFSEDDKALLLGFSRIKSERQRRSLVRFVTSLSASTRPSDASEPLTAYGSGRVQSLQGRRTTRQFKRRSGHQPSAPTMDKCGSR